MSAAKILLKAIIISIVLFFLIAAVTVWLISRHRQRKKEDKDIKNRGFLSPPIAQWGTRPYQSTPFVPPVQKPEAVVYPMQQPH